jgi:hypothetical protein
MRIITIRDYEMKCRTRWGWHTFRDGKDYKGKIIGFRFLGIGLAWNRLDVPHPSDDPNHVHPHDCGYTVTGRICNCDCKPPCSTAHDETAKIDGTPNGRSEP